MKWIRATLLALWGGAFVFLMSGGFLLWMVDVDGSDVVWILAGSAFALFVAAYTFWAELND